MKFILLIMVAFLDGHIENSAMIAKNAADCQERLQKTLEMIGEWNSQEANRVVFYAMSCTEPKKAPQGKSVDLH